MGQRVGIDSGFGLEVQLRGFRPANTKSLTQQVLCLKTGRPVGVTKSRTFFYSSRMYHPSGTQQSC